MRRTFLAALTFVVAVTSATVFLSNDKAAASVENIISDATFINENAMNEGQIAAFINRFPRSCLLPQNYPQGLSPISFIEPNSYFDHGTQQASAARIINKMSKYYHVNPQVILTTLEKEQALVSGSQGCATWRYNSAMGYNCPDGSENSLKSYPELGIYNTCVKNPGNAGFARQVNRAAWQLRFDQERAYGNLSWGGDGNVYYYGRMTEGWRSRQQGQPAAYYDGIISIGGRSFKVANGATAALYNYTPHFNSFERIFTAWFGSTQDSGFRPLETPRWMRTSKATKKIEVFGSNETNVTIEANKQIRFLDKIQIGNKWYLRTEYDKARGNLVGILQSDVEEIPYEPIAPKWVTLSTNGNKSIPNIRSSSGVNLERGTSVKIVEQITIDGNLYYRTEFDSTLRRNEGIHSKFVTDFTSIPLDTPRYFCSNVDNLSKINPQDNQLIENLQAKHLMITRKVKVNNNWYYQSQTDEETMKFINSKSFNSSCFNNFENPRKMVITEGTHKVNPFTLEEREKIEKDSVISLSSKILIQNRWYYRTAFDTVRNIDSVIPASSFKEL